MKRLIIILAAVATIAIKASAQTPATFNNEKGTVISSSSQADDTLVARVRIFPNPASDILRVSVDDANMNVLSQGEAVIYSSNGQAVIRKPYTTGTNDFYINNLSTGLYFLRLLPKSGGLIAIKQFAVVR
jgi:hypothetical protein